MGPIVLEPYYASPIWGDVRIAEVRGLNHSEKENCGEAFDVSAHPGVEGHIAEGPDAGMPFSRFLEAHHDEVMGSLEDDGTIQAVAMSARDHLSVQVHPGEEFAQAHEGDHGKVEAWYVLEAEPGATLIAGCATNDKEELRAAAADDTIGTRYGSTVPVQEGDFVLIPTGTMHALGPGIFCVEVGSLGNTTYRLCDWGRGRELHIERGFAVLDTEGEPQIEHLGAFDEEGPAQVRRGVTTDFYCTDVVDVRGSWSGRTEGRYAIVTCVAGEAEVTADGATVPLGYSRSVVIPAAAGTFKVSGTCRVLVSSRNIG